jgi:hypothetical protein
MEQARLFSADSHVNEPPDAWERSIIESPLCADCERPVYLFCQDASYALDDVRRLIQDFCRQSLQLLAAGWIQYELLLLDLNRKVRIARGLVISFA